MNTKYLILTVCLGMAGISGCDSQQQAPPEKKPRPVEVRRLQLQSPPDASLVTASVASWKTEQIGFEVSGRVEWVIEPNEEVEGRVEDLNGNLIIEGTPVARIENERYRLQVETARADVARANQSIKAATIELEKSLPAQIRSAQAEQNLALTEFNRSKKLFEKSAGSESEVDRDEAQYQTTVANVEQLEASLNAKEAELESLQSALLQAQQALQDAERNLKDCTLYSSFRGQIADVAVVPGSVVSVGQPVATVQMMDPIKVEVEVSAADSRRLQRRERVPVMVTQPDGTVVEEDGFLYLVDPVADPATRTYTVTLLVLNRKLSTAPFSENTQVARTDQTWRLDFQFLPGAEDGMLFVAEDAMLKDKDGYYVWKVENAVTHEPLPPDRLLKVRKLRIQPGPVKLPFLGNWVFQQVEVSDPEFDPEKHLIAGRLEVTEEDGSTGVPEEWNGDTILLDHGSQWMLRPGDLVRVNLSASESSPGYYVPMDAIVHDAGKTYLFEVEQSGDAATVRRREITTAAPAINSVTSSLRNILPASEESLDGLSYVTRGAHYLNDGEPVRVIRKPEAVR